MRLTRYLVAAAGLYIAVGMASCVMHAQGILPPAPSPAATVTVPRAATMYRRQFVANVRHVWGLTAPIAVMAAQVHQESAWKVNAKSAYAHGLAQFTPSTAAWISKLFPDLVENQPYNPAWAFRALARYDHYLHARQTAAASECDRWAFVLSSYNGGEGWLAREKRLAADAGVDSTRWFGHVERFNARAVWAWRENRGYPSRILLTIQPSYLVWGEGVSCE